MNTKEWYIVEIIDSIDTPALLVYKDRVLKNIRNAIAVVKDASRLRPHVKTNKMAEVCRMMMNEGITKFKCATIAEAEMLGAIGAKDVLFAFQPAGPKIDRLLALVNQYPATKFSCLIDHTTAAGQISKCFSSSNGTLDIYIDLNVGNNRTGVTIPKAHVLYDEIKKYPGIVVVGLHAYDGHVTDSSMEIRLQQGEAIYREVTMLRNGIVKNDGRMLNIVAGGSPTFAVYAQKRDVECSPGTFVFWDWSYTTSYPDEPFEYAALVVTRIMSIIDGTSFCTDLGHKSLAAEKPLPRVHFLNAPDAVQISHSEEHMVVKVPDTSHYSIGNVLYGVPVHICPTVSMYERAAVVQNKNVISEWKVTARDKRVTI